MKSYSSKELIKIIQQDGWYIVRTSGSHHQFKHPI
ncbi:type II toxin-antitoxin system HicA family toxin [Geobacillus sp. TFV-3]